MDRSFSAEWIAAKSLGDDGERLVCEHFVRLSQYRIDLRAEGVAW